MPNNPRPRGRDNHPPSFASAALCPNPPSASNPTPQTQATKSHPTTAPPSKLRLTRAAVPHPNPSILETRRPRCILPPPRRPPTKHGHRRHPGLGRRRPRRPAARAARPAGADARVGEREERAGGAGVAGGADGEGVGEGAAAGASSRFISCVLGRGEGRVCVCVCFSERSWAPG